ncbi:MAG: ThuA domain-containing protein [Planctomycetes bacterium]|nr:ThuA domain-containing protein [Planctomycetota bacterium]
MIRRIGKSRGAILLLAVAGIVLILGASSQRPSEVLIVQDELPQMKVLAGFLQEKGHLSVTIRDQASLPKDLSTYRAVLVFIHRDLQEATERAIIDYAQQGGRLICLHHSISSAKAANKFYFNFLGVRLDKGPMAAGGYAYKASGWTLVNLNPRHYITSFQVDWGQTMVYTPSDYPSVEGAYPSIRLGDDSEVFINHKFTDGREKTVLCGIVYQDKETGRTYMQDRGAWIKRQGKGIIVYFMPGHTASDYQKNGIARSGARGVSQMILNAIQMKED